MYIKVTVLLISLLTSVMASADLNQPYKPTVGDRLALCVERSIPLMDRTLVKDIRSYTKYDKHYVSLNSNSLFVNYLPSNNALDVIFVNNNHVENETKAEAAKSTLQSISSGLILPSLGYCSKVLGLEQEVKYSMLYIDPPYESRELKQVIKMDVSGKFTLP